MRTIKFRGYNQEAGWVIGDLIHEGEITCILSATNDGIPIIVDPSTIGQFTGLTDCDDKEIYEGDLIRCGDGCVYEVYWLPDIAAFMIEEYKSECDAPKIFLLSDCRDEYYVIGNIYDKKEEE